MPAVMHNKSTPCGTYCGMPTHVQESSPNLPHIAGHWLYPTHISWYKILLEHATLLSLNWACQLLAKYARRSLLSLPRDFPVNIPTPKPKLLKHYLILGFIPCLTGLKWLPLHAFAKSRHVRSNGYATREIGPWKITRSITIYPSGPGTRHSRFRISTTGSLFIRLSEAIPPTTPETKQRRKTRETHWKFTDGTPFYQEPIMSQKQYNTQSSKLPWAVLPRYKSLCSLQ